MQQTLHTYLPAQAVAPCMELIRLQNVHLKIVQERKTRYGDYRRSATGTHIITINANLNKYQFLLTLIHEMAHLVAFAKYGTTIKPHGKQWKYTYKRMILPFLHPAIFPSKLLPVLANHFKNPTASSDTDAALAIALQEYNNADDRKYIFQLEINSIFRLENGKVFKKGKKRIKRYECLEIASSKIYLFAPNAKVELLYDA